MTSLWLTHNLSVIIDLWVCYYRIENRNSHRPIPNINFNYIPCFDCHWRTDLSIYTWWFDFLLPTIVLNWGGGQCRILKSSDRVCGIFFFLLCLCPTYLEEATPILTWRNVFLINIWQNRWPTVCDRNMIKKVNPFFDCLG